MAMQTAGKIHALFEPQQKTERFRSREFVLALADNARYPQYVMFQLTGDRACMTPVANSLPTLRQLGSGAAFEGVCAIRARR